MMIKRISPLDMGLDPERTIDRNGWQIPLAYVGERRRNDIFISDLSHVPKWCMRGPNLDEQAPAGLKMPHEPGGVNTDHGVLLVRLIPSEARLMVLGDDAPVFNDAMYTDVTDGYASIAVVGCQCFEVLNKLSTLDLDGPDAPAAALAPVEEVTCLIVRLVGKAGVPGIIVSGARGYGHFLLDALLDAGRQYGIQPAGWERFSIWCEKLENPAAAQISPQMSVY
jgi:sarcosine oxidase gamma subunit